MYYCSSASADPNTASVTKEAKSPTSTGIVTESIHEEKAEQKSKRYNIQLLNVILKKYILLRLCSIHLLS